LTLNDQEAFQELPIMLVFKALGLPTLVVKISNSCKKPERRPISSISRESLGVACAKAA
jgi:hypothetical protein